jgi:hypothetical protein
MSNYQHVSFEMIHVNENQELNLCRFNFQGDEEPNDTFITQLVGEL